MIDEKKLRGDYIEQLSLGLQIDEAEPDLSSGAPLVSPEEAARRSETARQALEIKLGDVKSGISWVEDYQRILAARWPWRVAVYIAWASAPKKDRWPKTQTELATKLLGLTSDRVISTWRNRNPAIDELIGLLQAAPLLDHRRDIYDALVASATDPSHKSHQDRKLALEILGDYTPRMEVSDSRKPREDLHQYTDAELEEMERQGGGNE